ncbi:MAG: SelB C-terminal domain-containing protein [Candidatus Aminicenantaceae bacterium]
MKIRCFDAVVDFSPRSLGQLSDVFLRVKKKKVRASLEFFVNAREAVGSEFFVRVCPRQALYVKWRDTFDVEEFKSGETLGRGVILSPNSLKIEGKKITERIRFLQTLREGEREMLLALAQEKGIYGLMEREINEFCNLSKNFLRKLFEELEVEGKIRIISFSPLFLISQKSLDFLSNKIVAYLKQFHRKHSKEKGLSKERIKKRFELHHKILVLSLKNLEKQGLIREVDNLVALLSFRITLTPEEENILQELEDLCFKGEYRSVSLENFQQRFHLSSKKLHMMLSVLIEREKIVKGKNGFFLHSSWLNGVISKLKESATKELTVYDFKRMTGLTRKYAIPLLELLDQMGVTRRKSPSRREIL